jgi:molybdate transport repressor ModE-like protein
MHINIRPRWDFEEENGQQLHPLVIPLLEHINRYGNLAAAARNCEISYRHAWNILNKGNEFFNTPIAVKEKGKGAQLTALGQKLLWSNQRIEARLAPEMESLATELNVELQGAMLDHAPLVRIYASHGYAVTLMTQFAQDYRVEIHYHAPLHALIALNEGRCRIAGFHSPIGLSIPSQKIHYQKLLDPNRYGIIRFVQRQQGLIFHQSNPHKIKAIADLKKGGYSFINRQKNSGTRELFEQLLEQENIIPNSIEGYQDEEYTHSAVAAHIASGMADVGFGIETAAQRFDLGFEPVIKEHYLWAYPLEAETDEDIQAFINTLTDSEFHKQINNLPGYECDQCGQLANTNWLFED